MQATSRALDHLLRAAGDPVADLRDIGSGHPEFNRAQAIRAAVGVLAKVPDAFPAIAQAIRAVDDTPVSPRIRAHFTAAEAWLAGDPILAAESYALILSKWPRDLLALRLAQSCYFFLGWHDRLCAVVDMVMPAWPHDRRAFGFVLAMASFARAENGDAAQAEALGREALARDPACPLGVHAVTHAFVESGRHREGAQWMRDQRRQWARDSRMRMHNAWHLAMFDAELGNVASALGILDTWLLPASAQSALDACDAAALLWRLTTDGVGDTGRWDQVSAAFEQTTAPGFWPYVDLHAALAHLTARNLPRAQRLFQAIARCAEGDNYAALRARFITLPGVQALRAWSDGRFGEAAELFERLQPVLDGAGGSRVQLEIFRSIGREAARRQRGQGETHRPQPPRTPAPPAISVTPRAGVFPASATPPAAVRTLS